MDITLKKSLYEKKEVTGSPFNNEMVFLVFLPVAFFILGSTINYFIPEHEEEKEVWIVAVEVLASLIITFVTFIWFYLLTARLFKMACSKLPENHLLYSGLIVSFFCVFLITQSKMIQKIRFLADQLWTPVTCSTEKEEEVVTATVAQHVSGKKQVSATKCDQRETSLNDVMKNQYDIYEGKNHYPEMNPHNELMPNHEYNNAPAQNDMYQKSSQIGNYEHFTTDGDRQNRNEYIFNYRQHNTFEPMYSPSSIGSNY